MRQSKCCCKTVSIHSPSSIQIYDLEENRSASCGVDLLVSSSTASKRISVARKVLLAGGKRQTESRPAPSKMTQNLKHLGNKVTTLDPEQKEEISLQSRWSYLFRLWFWLVLMTLSRDDENVKRDWKTRTPGLFVTNMEDFYFFDGSIDYNENKLRILICSLRRESHFPEIWDK